MTDLPSGVRINLGASRTRLPGYVNVDIVPWADVSVDLGREPLPFDDDSAEVVFSYHTLEHVDDYLAALKEIHRVLRNGGWLLVGVPYVTLTEFNLVNPYHKHHFNEHSFDFFDPEKLLGSAGEDAEIVFRQVFHEFHYLPEFADLPEEKRRWCRRHLFNVVRAIDFGLQAVKDGDALEPVDEALRIKMRTEFQKCLSSREAYPESRQ